jgi:hypothetical protein
VTPSSSSPFDLTKPGSAGRGDGEASKQGTIAGLTLPESRGPLSRWVMDTVRGRPADAPTVPFSDPFDDDLQLALYCCYETHFTTLPEALGEVEWDLDLLRFRRELEWVFELGLRGVIAASPGHPDGS